MAPKTGHTPTDRRATQNEELTKRPAPPRVKAIRVRATRTGYYEHIRRREGDVFDLVPREGIKVERIMDPTTKRAKIVRSRITLTPDEQFSDLWMEEVHPRTPLAVSTSQEEIRRQHDELRQAARPAGSREIGEELEAPGQADTGGATGDEDPLGAGQ